MYPALQRTKCLSEKVEKTNDNTDKFLYKINENKQMHLFGEIEVQGF
jgi:hypothetical protein